MNNGDSVILKLEILNKRYENLLSDYTQTQKEYLDYLQQSASSTTSFGKLTSVDGGYSFYGTKPLQTTTQLDKDTCAAICSSLDGCTGGTFNANTSSCALVAGDGKLNKSNDTADVALMYQYKLYLEKLQLINSELSDVNQEILVAISSGQSIYNDQDMKRGEKADVLQKNYGTLMIDKENIEKSLRDIEEKSNKETETSLRAKSAYYGFILTFFIVFNIVAIFLSPNSQLFFLFFIEFLIFMFFIRY